MGKDTILALRGWRAFLFFGLLEFYGSMEGDAGSDPRRGLAPGTVENAAEPHPPQAVPLASGIIR